MPSPSDSATSYAGSLLTPMHLAEDKRLCDVQWDSDGNTLIWLEERSGHGVILAVDRSSDAPRELTLPLRVRAEVGYGGGDFAVHGGHVYFIEQNSGRIWRKTIAPGPAVALTPQFGKAASPVVSPDGRWVVYVHHDDDGADRLAVVPSDGTAWPRILTEGHDFYMQPRFDSDGGRLAWIAWDHPQMPWDGTRLFIADFDGDDAQRPRLGDARQIAGGEDVAVQQPQFDPFSKAVFYLSDESGFGAIYRHDPTTGEKACLTDPHVEFASACWIQGLRTFVVSQGGDSVFAKRVSGGIEELVRVGVNDRTTTPLAAGADYGEFSQLALSPPTGSSSNDRLAVIASGPTIPARVLTLDVASGTRRIVARASSESIPADRLCTCRSVQWPTTGGETAHGLYYPPQTTDEKKAGKPPLVVLIHGGPTSQAKAGWHPQSQFLATRGFGVLLVNYRGSTGYGREYMLKLRGKWGICDVEDAVSGLEYLASAGEIDGERAAIMGGSAGGFTVLQTMIDHPDAFAAGVCMYGVVNQFDLAADTHKFESRYLDSLLGPLPEAAAVYRQRSPQFHAAAIRRPVAIFQGALDRVVPKAQAEVIVDALKSHGVEHEYHLYDNEGHGWRHRDTIEHFYTRVEAFLKHHLLYAVPDAE